MVERHTQGTLTWIDLFNPTDDEIHSILEETTAPPEFFADFGTPVPRSESVCMDKAIKVTADFPIVKRTDIDHPHEIKFVVTKRGLITARYEEMEATDRFTKEFEVLSTLHKNKKKLNGVDLFFGLMHELYTSLGAKLDYLETRMLDIEKEVFNEHEKEMVFTLSQVSRRLITFRHTLKTHTPILSELRDSIAEVFGTAAANRIDELDKKFSVLMQRTDALFESLDELRDTNYALLTTKQNEIMKIFTILAFVTFPLTLFTSLFGMNTVTAPIVGKTGDFWIIIGIMTVVASLFFIFFKYKKWL